MGKIVRIQGVNAIPVNPEGKILLQQRDDRPDLSYPGCWATFGGQVEDGETPDEALRRELLEEIELVLPMILWRIDDDLMERDDQTIIAESYTYVGRIDLAASEITLNEGQALGYFGPEDLDDLKIGFNFEPLFRDFFAAWAAGELPLE
jgi:8-oxo-dGTP pyrophosphatase MutT (NUDIX family)